MGRSSLVAPAFFKDARTTLMIWHILTDSIQHVHPKVRPTTTNQGALLQVCCNMKLSVKIAKRFGRYMTFATSSPTVVSSRGSTYFPNAPRRRGPQPISDSEKGADRRTSG